MVESKLIIINILVINQEDQEVNKMKKIAIFLMMTLSIFSKDLNLNVGEGALNKFIGSLGEFKGDGVLDLKLTKFSYVWRLYDARIDLIENGSKFFANIDISTDGKTRKGTVEGEAKFSYDVTTQKLNVEVENLKFRGLDLFNLAGFYKPTYALPVELLKNEKISIKKNDKETIILTPTIYEEELKVSNDSILIEANVKFEETK